MAHIEALCTSQKKGIVKREQEECLFTLSGIEGDAHAGDWHRQVSLLAGESIDQVKEKLPTLKNGAFAENVIIRGLDFTAVRVGDRLKLGDSVLVEITQIGKKCHNDGCAIKKATGDCIMPREGLFARVIEPGRVSRGDGVEHIPA